jgi:hypothetical protein
MIDVSFLTPEFPSGPYIEYTFCILLVISPTHEWPLEVL